MLSHHHERNVCFLEPQVILRGCDYIVFTRVVRELTVNRKANRIFIQLGIIKLTKGCRCMFCILQWYGYHMAGPSREARHVDHFLNDIDSAWTVEGRTGDRVEHRSRESLTTGKGLSLVDPLIRLIFIPKVQKLDIGFVIKVCEDLHLLIVPCLDAEAAEHGFLVIDGLLVTNAGRESGEDDTHTALTHIGLFQVGQVEWGAQDQVNIWEHADLRPLLLKKYFVADDHHRLCVSLGDGIAPERLEEVAQAQW